jgi:hypothetical protein
MSRASAVTTESTETTEPRRPQRSQRPGRTLSPGPGGDGGVRGNRSAGRVHFAPAPCEMIDRTRIQVIWVPLLALCGALGPAALQASAADEDAAEGLLPVRLLEPRFAPFLTWIPTPPPPRHDELRLAATAGTGQVWRGDTGPGGSFGASAQTVAATLEGCTGIGDFLSAGFEVPALAHARSFKRPEDRCRVDLRYGETVLAASDEPDGGLADSRFAIAAHARNPRVGISWVRLSAVLKAPSGRREAFAGTGSADFGAFLDVCLEPVPGLYVHGLVGAVRPGSVPGLAGGPRARFRAAVPFAVGLEARLGSGWAAVLQVNGSNNFHPETGCARLDEHPLQATAGCSWRFAGRAGLFLSFSEDLSRGAPDFAVSCGLWITLERPDSPSP